MNHSFTEYVRTSWEDAAHGWSRFEAVLQSLRAVLVQELKRRDLWNAPPRYLGVFGGNRWDEADLLDELVLECFEYVFVRRIQGLRNQARVHTSIDGLIILNVQHFLHDAQRRHDPLGYRVFEIVRDAVEALLKSGSLHLLAGDPKIRNDTLLGFSTQADETAVRSPCHSQIRGWNDSLMPDLVTAWHREEVVAKLTACIAGLAREFPAFRFRDLVHPLKEDARRRWLAMMWEDVESVPDAAGAQPLLMSVVEPRMALEEAEEYQRLLACTARGIEQAAADERTKGYLRKLLNFLRVWTAALEEGPAAGPPPPDRRISEMLQIPRGRLPELKAALGGLVDSCRGRRAAAGEGRDAGPAAIPASVPTQRTRSEAGHMNLSSRREQLGRRSLEARTRNQGPAEGPPVAGDTLIFPGVEPGLEWLLVAQDGGRALLVPLDAMPLIGGRDMALEELLGEPLTARCSFPVWLADDALAAGSKARHVADVAVQQTLAKLEEVERNAGRPTLFEQEAEADSEYRDWKERLRASATQLQARNRPIAPRTGAVVLPGWRSLAPALALAATLLVALAGLALHDYHLSQRLREATRPILIPSGASTELRLGVTERGLETRLVPAGRGHLLLYLVFRDVPELPRYAVRLLHADGSVWWQSPTFPRGEQLLILPVRAEAVRLQLLGIGADGDESVLDDRRLVPEAPAPPTGPVGNAGSPSP